MSETLSIHTLPVSPFAMNCYVLSCRNTKEAVIIDAGDEPQKILELIKREGYKLKMLINTHAHVDHTSAVAVIQETEGVPFYIHEAEKGNLEMLPSVQQVYGFGDGKVPSVDGFLTPDKKVQFGEISLQVLETPGHTMGGVCFLWENYLFVGDTLFAGSIGRTDLPGGNYDTLLESIKREIFTLDDTVEVLSGHGPATSVGNERKTNPFFR